MPSLSIEHLCKSYGNVSVLDNLQLSIEDGDFLVLLGPSGCGKSTLLNLIAGLAEVTSGRIMIGDNDVTELEPKDRGLAMVFQSYALYPTKTVEGNMRFGLSSSKLPKEEVKQRVSWATELLQLGPFLKRKPSELSGGQRQRVAIGRALVKHSDVLLFDEPLSNLDAKLRIEMRTEIKKLHENLKPTIVYVTHDQIEAMTMATKIAIMNDGEIQQFGTPDEIYEQPRNLFVAGFIGSLQMNLLPGQIDSVGVAILEGGEKIDISAYEFGYAPSKSRDVIFGLRPEHFTQKQITASMSFELPIAHIERTGSDTTVSLAYGEQNIAIRFEPEIARGLNSGDMLQIQYPKNKLNIFAQDSGLRL